MLRYDHSKTILEGLFERKLEVDYVPEEESDPSEWKYANKPIRFPIDGKVNEDGTVDEDTARIYIGLFTTAPIKNGEGEGYVEPGPDSNTTWTEYTRIRLNTKSRLKRVEFLSGAKVKNNAAGTAQVAYVENDDMILFPEAIGSADNEDGWGKIVGFGLFYSKEGGHPFLWGDIKADNNEKGVPVPKGHVPVIRESGLQISLE